MNTKDTELTKRQAMAKRLAELEAQAAKNLPRLREVLEMAEDAINRHDETRKELVSELGQARLALNREQQNFDRERNNVTAVLLETANPKFDEAIDFFRNKTEEILKTTVNTGTRKAGKDLVKQTKKLMRYSNSEAIQGAAAYCRYAVTLLEKMKLDPEFDPSKIEDLKKNIPDPNRLTEYEAEKPVGKDPGPFAGLMSDSELNWKIGKLSEKFRKLTGRPY